jgi:hypothetical protein
MAFFVVGSGGGSGSGGSIARDMYFTSVSQRNTFTNNNPNRIFQGVTCAVEAGGPDYDYYQWDGNQWRTANLIYQGRQGLTGDAGVDVSNAEVDANGDLIVTLSDGTVINAGVAKGADGLDGVDVTSATVEPNGDLVITLSDNSTVNAGNVTDSITHDGNVTKAFISGDGLTSDHDPATNETILHVEPLLFDANPTVSITSGDGITATHDPATNEVTLSADIPTAIDLSDYQEISALEIDYPSILQDGKQVANFEDIQKLLIDGELTDEIIISTGITASRDPVTGKVTLTVDPTNIDLSGYAELDTDVSFSKLTVTNPNDAAFISDIAVTDAGDTELGLVGDIIIRKRDKVTGDLVDIASIDSASGLVDLRTDVTYQGAITEPKAPVTLEYLEAFGRGIGVPAYTTVEGGNTYQQDTPVASFQNSGTNINDVIIEINSDLLESETIITIPTDSYVTTKNYIVFQGAFGNGTNRSIKAGDTWRVRHTGTEWFWEKIYSGGGGIVYGLGGRGDITTERSVKLFAYREGMPEHLLIETPESSRLVHEFPRNKTFRFTPINSAREHDGNVSISQGNQGVAVNDLELGQYSDIPLYIIEPNVVVNRDQRAWINFPASITIDITNGFYVFGTVSGWCGNNNTEGNVAVYLGTSENFRSYTNNIGFVLGNSGLFLLDGFNLRTPNNNTLFAFNIEPGVTHMYRYAFYVDFTGMMNYYIVDLNTGQVSQGEQQCNLASIGSDPKLYISYDRYANNTSAIAIAETHLVINSVGSAEDRWNWRN